MNYHASEKRFKTFTIVFVILAFFLGATGMYLVVRFVPIEGSTIINKSEKEVTVNESGIADAVEKIYDAVVTVETYSNKKKVASGTGFVYKTNGDKAYILTNNHVIESGDQVYVTFTDGKQVEVKLVGKDTYSDIAVLEVNKDDIIKVAEIGKSESARVGDTVFAVGAPLDTAYSWTVTRGILSGKDRMVEVSLGSTASNDWIMKVHQTDAAINSGNSGGPLSNSNGEVIGITSLKLVSSGVEGIGFAIPIEDALEFAAKLEKGESVTRPFLGVSMIDLHDKYSQFQTGISVSDSITSGVIVATVESGSPAEKAGLKKGDVITELGGKKVTSIAELRYYLYKYKVGDTIEVKYIRGTDSKTGSAKLVASK